MATEIVPIGKKLQTTRELLDKMKPALAAALPRFLSPERLARVVLTECMTSVQRARPGAKTLLDCTPESFAGAVLQCAALGLEPGVLGQAYLIPFENRRRSITECQLVPGYKGLIMLARRSGQILTIDPVIVRLKDVFTVSKGTKPGIHHVPFRPTPEDTDPGPAVAYYAVAVIKGGGVQFEHMWRADVERHRDRFSRAASDGPWVTDFDAMGLKTVLRRLCKFLPVSIDVQTLVALDEAHEAGLPQDLGVSWLDVPAAGQGDEAEPRPLTAAEVVEATTVPAPTKLDAALANRKKAEPPDAVA